MRRVASGVNPLRQDCSRHSTFSVPPHEINLSNRLSQGTEESLRIGVGEPSWV